MDRVMEPMDSAVLSDEKSELLELAKRMIGTNEYRMLSERLKMNDFGAYELFRRFEEMVRKGDVDSKEFRDLLASVKAELKVEYKEGRAGDQKRKMRMEQSANPLSVASSMPSGVGPLSGDSIG